ncbi:MAG: hypothetical protein ABFD75_07730 [Smithella sp.]
MPDQTSVIINTLAKSTISEEESKQYLTGESVYEVEIQLLSSNPQPSTLSVQKSQSITAVSLSEPVKIDFENLQKLIDAHSAKPMSEDDVLKRFLNSTHVACNAFYYRTDTAEKDETKQKDKTTFLIEFAMAFTENESNKGGLISALTNCKEIANLFDVRGVSVSVVKGKKEDYKYLQTYAAQLVAAGKPPVLLPTPEKKTENKPAEDAQGGQKAETTK